MPIKDIILHWYLTVTTSLFLDHFHFRFNPKEILAEFHRQGVLDEKRKQYRDAINALIDTVLAAYSTSGHTERILSETDPRLIALYYDRVVFGTWWLDNTFPVLQNPPLEIPRDWHTFVRLLLRQEWFA